MADIDEAADKMQFELPVFLSSDEDGGLERNYEGISEIKAGTFCVTFEVGLVGHRQDDQGSGLSEKNQEVT